MNALADMTPEEKRELLGRMLAKKQRRISGEFPLSHGQRSLWFLYQLAPSSSAYNVALAWRFRVELDVGALRSAFQSLVDRHAVLRTTYGTAAGEAVQRVHASQEVSFVNVDARADDEGALHDRVADAVSVPFDLENGPVMRVHVFSRGKDDHVQLVTIHHIAFDMWSSEILMSELRALYVAAVGNTTATLPSIDRQYFDFVSWQAAMLAAPAGEAHWAYWKDRLAGDLPVLQLPLDRPRPRTQTYAGSAVSFDVDAAVVQRVRAFSANTGATPYMTFLSAFLEILHRYTRQPEILVGAPTLGRSQHEFESIVGYFVNPVVFRAALRTDRTFEQLVADVRRTVVDALDHQDFPFPLLVERLNVTRDPARAPLTDVFFVWDRARTDHNDVSVRQETNGARRVVLDWGAFALESFSVSQSGTPSDLVLLILEHGDSFAGHLTFNTDLFDRATVENIAAQFQTLLAHALAAPTEQLSRLSLLETQQRERLLDLSARAIPVMSVSGTLHGEFQKQVARVGDKVAVRDGNDSVTYRDLAGRAERLARRLRAIGVVPGSLVALSMARSIDVIIAILAILKTGAAYLPLDVAYPIERRRFMLQDSGARVVVTTAECVDDFADFETLLIDGESAETTAYEPCAAGTASDLAYVIYTSGSTGRPKGVMVTHANVLRLFESTSRWFDFDESDVWSLFHSYSFDFSVWEIWGALLYGGSIVVVPQAVSRAPEDFYRLLADTGITVLSQTPSAFRQLLWAEERLDKRPALALRWIVFGGEALDLPSLRPWFDRHGEQTTLVNMYGITETTVHVTFREIRVEDTRAGTASLIGEPITDLSLYVLDEHQQLLPIGVPGELYVGGAGLARGYLNRPELTAERFISNPFVDEPGERLYRTGDLVRRRSDGDIEYLGRIDNQIQVRGFRVELGEIEAVLSAYPGVQQAVVVARNFADGDTRLIAYVVTATEPSIDVERLRRHAQRDLPDYMVPAAFVMLDRLPLTPNGKIDHAALPDAIVARVDANIAFVAPRTVAEQQVATIWSEVLAVDRVGALDNFFDLGGHSLLGTRVAARLADEFGVDFPLKLFFEAPTVEAVAERVEQMLLGSGAATADDVPRDEFEL